MRMTSGNEVCAQRVLQPHPARIRSALLLAAYELDA